MSENPYESPKAKLKPVGGKALRRADLKDVTVGKNGILICTVIQIVLLFVQFLVDPSISDYFLFGSVGFGVLTMVFLFIVSMKVYSIVMAVVLAILSLIPYFGIVLAIFMYIKAIGVLRAAGYQAGLLGTGLGQFRG